MPVGKGIQNQKTGKKVRTGKFRPHFYVLLAGHAWVLLTFAWFIPQWIVHAQSENVTITAEVPLTAYNAPGAVVGLFSSSDQTVALSGWAYPNAEITVLKDGEVAEIVSAHDDGFFEVFIRDVSEASYVFGVYAVDSEGNTSAVSSRFVRVSGGTGETVNDLFLSPTLLVDRSSDDTGQVILFRGQTTSSAIVRVSVWAQAVYSIEITADDDGIYEVAFDASAIGNGTWDATARAFFDDMESDESRSASFLVDSVSSDSGDQNGNENVSAIDMVIDSSGDGSCPASDLNGDCRVSLIDFSILAFWYLQPPQDSSYDLRPDGIIDLIDFSILAYDWTG